MAERLKVLHERAYPESIFYTGAPNPRGQAALLPALEAMFTKVVPAELGAALALECRTWACRLKVLQPADTDTETWERAIVVHPTLKGRILGSQVTARRPQADPFQGQRLAETTVFFKLADPSGGRAGLTRPRTPEWDPFFRKGPDCPAHLDLVQKRTRLLDEAIARDHLPAERFRASLPNDGLSRELTPILQQALAAARPDLAPPRVACRGSVCEVSLPGRALAAKEWLAVYWRRPGWGSRVTSAAPAGDRIYLTILPATLVDGHKLLADLVAAIDAQSFLDTCHVRHPARGHLLLRYVLPSADDTSPPRPIRVEYSGSLVDTPLARCVRDEIDRALATETLPAIRAGAYQDARYDWPRETPRP